jgi:hypothetical protein
MESSVDSKERKIVVEQTHSSNATFHTSSAVTGSFSKNQAANNSPKLCLKPRHNNKK